MSDSRSSDNAPSRLQQLGGQFIERTKADLLLMDEQMALARNADSAAKQQMLLLAHRMNGSAAMLGFAAISEPARNIESTLRREVVTAEQWQLIAAYLQQLRALVLANERNLLR